MKNKKNHYFKLFILFLLISLIEFAFILNNKHYKVLSSNRQIIPTPIPNNVVNMDSLATLTHWQKGVFYSVKVTSQSRGKILNIDAKDGRIEENGWQPFNYALKITIEGENGFWNDLHFNKMELEKTNIIEELPNGQTEKITSKDLKNGDKIEASITMDLTKDFANNFVSAKIIKLSK